MCGLEVARLSQPDQFDSTVHFIVVHPLIPRDITRSGLNWSNQKHLQLCEPILIQYFQLYICVLSVTHSSRTGVRKRYVSKKQSQSYNS